MANNKRKITFKSLAILFFATTIALLGAFVLGAENIHFDESIVIKRNTLQLNQEYVSNPYIVVGDRVFTYAELTVSEVDSVSAQMSAGAGYKIWFDESNKLELVFYQETSLLANRVLDDSNLSTAELKDSNIASKLQAVKNDDGSIDITIIDPTDIVYISTSGDAEYTLYGLAFGTSTALSYDDGFYIGEQRSPISFSAVTTSNEAQILKINKGNFSFSGAKTYKPNSGKTGRAFWVVDGNLTLNQITLDGFGCSDENYNGGAVYVQNGALNLNCNISNCYATNGGAVAMDAGTLAVDGGEYSSNSATNNGGVIYYLDENKLTISNGTFSGNTASYGGVVYAETNITISDGIFNGNSATMGGVVYGTDTQVVAEDVTNLTDGKIRFNRTLTKPSFASVDVDFTLVLENRVYDGSRISVAEDEEYGITYLEFEVTYKDETDYYPIYIFSDDSGEIGTGWLIEGTDYYDYFSTITITKDPNNPEFTAWIKANAKTVNGSVTISGGTFSSNTIGSSMYSSAGSVVYFDGKAIINGGSFLGNISGYGVFYSTGDTTISSGETATTFEQNYGLVGLVYAGRNLTISGGTTVPKFANQGSDFGTFVVGGDLVINNGEFISNGAGGGNFLSGSGVFHVVGTTTIYNGIFDDNSGEDSVIESVGDVTIYGGQFKNSHSRAYGTETAHVSGDGAVIFSNGTVTILGGEFTDNSTGSAGKGGVVNTVDGDIIISGGKFSGNYANMGGVIYTQNGNITISAGTFSGNHASIATHMYSDDTEPGFGGVIYSVNGNVTITGGEFGGNHANAPDDEESYGGVVYAETGDINITGIEFASSTATSGGVVYTKGALTLTNCTFSQNSATSKGGAVYTEGALTITGCTFRENSSSNYGAVAYTKGALTMSDCTVESNSATYSVVECDDGDYAVSITNCKFNGNSSSSRSIIEIDGEKLSDGTIKTRTVDIVNCLFIENAADDFVIDADYSAINLTDCSFLFNAKSMMGGNGSNVSVKNSDAENNTIIANSNEILGTWVFNKTIDLSVAKTFSIDYSLVAGATNLTQLGIGTANSDGDVGLWYATEDSMLLLVYDENGQLGEDLEYQMPYVRTITITGGADATSAELLAWLQANGTKTLDSVVKNDGTFAQNVFLGNGYCLVYIEKGNLEFIGQNCVDNANEVGLLVAGDATISKCNFIGETVLLYEIVSVISDNGMTVSDCQFLNCWQYNYGKYGFITYADSLETCSITNCNFENNEFGVYAIQIAGTVIPEDAEGDYGNIISNCTFSNNTSEVALVCASDVGSITISNCEFEDNDVLTNAKAESCLVVVADAVTAVLENCEFINNVGKMGGVVYSADGGSVTIAGGTFSGNRAIYDADVDGSGYGGVIYSEGSGTVTITDGEFSGNSALAGGVVYSEGDVTISGGTFSENEATYVEGVDGSGLGGVVFMFSEGTVTIQGANGVEPVFSENSALMGGVIAAGLADISGGEFGGNGAQYGGVIYGDGTIISDGTFNQNEAMCGGVIYASGVIISGGAFSENSATYSSSSNENVGNGGVVFADAVNISNGEFTQNSALRGGVVYVSESSTISGGTFNFNIAMCGGVVYGDCGYSDITDITDGQIELNQTLTKPTFTSIDVEFEIPIYGGVVAYMGSKISVVEENGYTCLAFTVTFNGETNTLVIYGFNDDEGNEINEWVDGEYYELLSTISITNDPNSDEFTSWIKANAKKLNGADTIFNGGTFSSNSADAGGVAYNACGGQLIVTDGYFSNNCTEEVKNFDESRNGGVFYIDGNGVANISGGTFTENISFTHGGVIYSTGGILTISGGEFSNNKAERGSGGVVCGGTSVEIAGGNFTDNYAQYYGGVFECGEISILGGTFIGNCSQYGGVIHGYNVNIQDGIFTGNYASWSGGVLYVSNTSEENYLITISGGKFENNYTGGGQFIENSSGGVVYIYGKNSLDTSLIISGGIFENNSAQGTSSSSGGAIWIRNINLSISGGEFTNNSATYGTVAYSIGGNVNISGGIFDGTSSLIYVKSGEATITGGEFKNSTTAIYAPNGLTLGGATFDGNETDIYLGETGYITLTTALTSELKVYKDGLTNYDNGDESSCYVAYSDNQQILESAENYIVITNIVTDCELSIDILPNYLVCVTEEIYGIYDISTGKIVHKWRKMLRNGDVSVVDNTLVLVNKSYSGRMLVSDSVTSIGTGAFVDSMLSQIYLPDSVTTIQDDAFSTSNAVMNNLEVLKIGIDIASVGNMNLPNLTTLYIGNLTTWCEANKTGEIWLPATNLYISNTKTTDVVIPDGTTAINGRAFRGVNAITSVSIPASVTHIGAIAFDQTLNNISFVVDSANANYASDNGVLFDKNLTTLIAYPLARGSNYALPTQTTTIAENAFFLAKNVTGLTFNNALATIEDSAFGGLNYLEGSAINISLPNSLTSLEQGAFAYAKLANVTLGTGLETISKEAFAGSTITSINLNNIKAIEEYAFYDCASLGGTLEIANNCTIEECAFMNCSALEKVVFAGDISQIASRTFSGCSNIVEYNFKNCTSVPVLENVDAFEGINDNCKIYVPSSLYILWILHINWQDYAEYIVKPVTTITFEANGGALNHAQTIQVEFGSALALPALTDGTKARAYKEGYILLGYTYINNIESAEDLTASMLFDSNGQSVSGVTGYTNVDGLWICTDEELTIYAIWQVANAYLLTYWKTVLADVERLNDKNLLSIAFVNEIPEGYTYVASLGATDKTGETAYSFTLDCTDVEAYVDTSSDSGYHLVLYSTGTIYAPEDSSSLFGELGYCTTIDFGDNFDTSKVTDMSWMFSDCSSLTSLDVSNFDTSNVTSMSMMFYNCSSLTSLNLSNFNTSNVTDMGSMFRICSSLTSLNLSNFNTSNVTNMFCMFDYCESLTSLDVTNFNTSKVTDMESMFEDCSSLTSLDVSNFDTSNVTDMGWMFYNCSSLTSLDVTNFDTSKVTSMGWMFQNCSSLTCLDVSKFDTSNVTDMGSMFYNCSSLTSITFGENFDTSNVTDMGWMFQNCSKLTSLDVTNFNTSNVTDMSSMFNGCSSLISLDVSNFNTSKVTYMNSMFRNCSSLTSLDLSNFDTSKVTNMSYMFSDCSSLTSLNLSSFNISNVNNMWCMFRNCSSLTSLDLSNFDTSNVTRMDKMFYNCSSLTSLDVSVFDTSKVEYMFDMFYNCTSLETLNISNFTISSRGAADDMLTGCTALKTLYAPKEIVSGAEITLPITMYYFDGANVASTSALTSTQAGKTLYSTYSTVTFVVKSGSSSMESKQVLLGEKYGSLPSITINTSLGYTTNIDGWYTQEVGGTKVTASTIVSTVGDHTLYAHYTTTENSYTISYNLNGGSITSAPTSAKYSDVVEISTPTRSGYIFAGWTISGHSSLYAKYGDSKSAINTLMGDGTTPITAQYFQYLTYTSGGKVTFTANWTQEQSYEITYSCLPDGYVAYCASVYIEVDGVQYTVDSTKFTCTADSVITVVANSLKQSYGSDTYGIAIVHGDYTYSQAYGYSGAGIGTKRLTLSTSEIINNINSTLYVGLYHNDSYVYYGLTTYSVSIEDYGDYDNFANNTITATYALGSTTEELTTSSGITLYKRDGDNNLYLNKSFASGYRITKLDVSYDGFTCSKFTASAWSSDTDALAMVNPTYTGNSDKTYYPVLSMDYTSMTVCVMENGVQKYPNTSGSVQGIYLYVQLAGGYCSVWLTPEPVDSSATQDNRIYYSTFLSEFSVEICNNSSVDKAEIYYSEGVSGTDSYKWWVVGKNITIKLTSGLTTSTSLGVVEIDNSPMMGSWGIVTDDFTFGAYGKPSASACADGAVGAQKLNVDDVSNTPIGLTSATIDDAGLFDSSGNLLTSWQSLVENGKITVENNYISSVDSSLSGELVIPDGIVGIKSYAFASCNGLTKISIPASVNDIEYYAFYCCENIETLEVDSENSTYLSSGNCIVRISDNCVIAGCKNSVIPNFAISIGIGAFYGCAQLTEIIIPEGVETIDYYAFCDCDGLTYIEFPSTLTTIGKWAFEECSSLESVTFGAGLVDVQTGAFAYCSRVVEYNFINCQNVPMLGKYAFENISSLCVMRISSILYSDWQDSKYWSDFVLYMVEFKQYGLVELSTGELMVPFENMVEGGYLLFGENDDGTLSFAGFDEELINEMWQASLEYGYTFKFVMPESVLGYAITSISPKAFDLSCLINGDITISLKNLNLIKQIELPSRLQKIENYAFSGANYLDNIQIPASVVEIEPLAFYNCSSLTNINVVSRNENYCSLDGVVFDKSKETLVAFPANRGGTYSIPTSVKTIGVGAFAYSGLSNIVIPTSIEHISAMAFASCSGIEVYDFRAFASIPTLDGEGEFENIKSGTIIYVPTSLYSAWRTADGWRNYRGNIYADNIVLEAGLYDAYTGDLTYSWAELISQNIISVENNIITGSNSKLLNGRLVMSNDITAIGGGVFENCTGLTAVTLSNNLTAIGEGAFRFCSFIEKIIIPAKVSTIGENAFTGCVNLTKLEVESGNSSFVAMDNVLFDSSISTLIYYANGKTGSYTIPNSVSTLAPYAFAYSINLTSLTIPNSVTSIGDYGIAFCTGLSYLEIPASITVIEAHTFVGNSNLKEYSFRNHTVIPELKDPKAFGDYEIEIESETSLYDFDFYAFFVIYVPATLYDEWQETGNWTEFVSGWDEFNINNEWNMDINRIMTEPVEIDKSVPGVYSVATGLLVSTWEECLAEGLVTVSDNQIIDIEEDIGLGYYLVIAEGITSLAYGVGYQCELYGIHFPSTLKSIGIFCFILSTITEINIPASCTSIGDYAFIMMPYCTAINVEEGNPVYSSENGVLFNKTKTKLLIYPAGKGGTYVVPDTVVEIGECAFLFSLFLQKVILPSSVAIIGDYAFIISGIFEIVMSNNVTEIGEYAFGDCVNLTNIRLGDRLTTIGKYAFADCKNLVSIDLPNSLTTLGESAFRGCENLSGTINLYGVQYISNYAFLGLTKIEKVIFSDNLISIGEQAFDGCIGLTGALVIADSCTNIGQAAFRDTRFTSLSLGSGITRIESYTFQNCTSLQSISLGENITYLGNFAFAGCTSATCHCYNRTING